MNLSLDNPVGILVKTTCVDYPGMVASTFFLKGCNLYCPYCYNVDLVDIAHKSDSDSNQQNSNPIVESQSTFISLNELFSHLEKRAGIISGLVISGGEPLLNPNTPVIIKKAKSLGYKIKIDTNGTLPDKLRDLINNSELRPDFIAMDIKTSPEKYARLMCKSNSVFYDKTDFFEKTLSESIKLISDYAAEQREWRTVLVPGLVEKEDIQHISEFLPQDASWQFANFANGQCLDSSYNDLTPYTDAETKNLIEYAKTFIPKATLR